MPGRTVIGHTSLYFAAAALILVAAACSGAPAEPSTTTSPSTSVPAASAASSPSGSAVICPNVEGGQCLGELKAGTEYTTKAFAPALTYRVPQAGWSNFEDLSGNFLLTPPGNGLAGVNAGTSDFIGVYRSVTPSVFSDLPTCAIAPAPQVATTPEAMTKWMQGQAVLDVSTPTAVNVSGLTGLVTDVRVRKGAKVPHCEEGGDRVEVALLFSGLPPSSLDHGAIPNMTMRLYMLAYSGDILSIEVSDIDAAPGNADEYSKEVEQFRFNV